MDEIFSGTSILRYGLGLVGRASTNILRVDLGLHTHCGPCGHKWQKVAQTINGMR